MKVFKFGGASVKDAEGVRNTASILRSFSTQRLLVVISAMGKTTNALEKILALYYSGQSYHEELAALKQFHSGIIDVLIRDKTEVNSAIEKQWSDLEKNLSREKDFDEVYDQIVSIGELVSTLLVHHFLIQEGIPSRWLDAREYIDTDDSFREGKVNWENTTSKIRALRNTNANDVIVTQGFIGRTSDGLTTTLGREGSDYSAAIFASALRAESVTIWKDVPGVMNADPKRLPAAVVFEELPFKEAAEMTYYGASVIHPKTIKPLANLGIPLYVKNFTDPSLPGTKIHECTIDHLPPLIIFKDNQCLISCKVTDYTFVSEQQLSIIFSALSDLDIRINLMQNSAISFTFCIDYRESKVMKLIGRLQQYFEVYYNLGLTLITVKNYDEKTFETYRKKPGVILEQHSRSTLQVLVKP